MMNSIQKTLLGIICVFAVVSQSASALTYDISLYEPGKIAKRGIVAAVQETNSGALECTLTFDKKLIGVTSIGFHSKVKNTVVDFELQTHDKERAVVCRFTISRDLLMHGQISVGVKDSVPGGTFYHVAFVDFIEFGAELSPILKRRLARLVEMGLIKDHAAELQQRIEEYSKTTPARDKKIDPRILAEELEKPHAKTKIFRYKSPVKKP